MTAQPAWESKSHWKQAGSSDLELDGKTAILMKRSQKSELETTDLGFGSEADGVGLRLEGSCSRV